MPLTSACGIDCSSCDAYKATVANDDQQRKTVADKWREEYHSPSIKPEDINCLGCLGSFPLYQHCLECGVRLCALAKKLTNCGQCPDFPCAKSESLHQYIPDAKKVCEEIHKKTRD